jgi:hypothetical protein
MKQKTRSRKTGWIGYAIERLIRNRDEDDDARVADNLINWFRRKTILQTSGHVRRRWQAVWAMRGRGLIGGSQRDLGMIQWEGE